MKRTTNDEASLGELRGKIESLFSFLEGQEHPVESATGETFIAG